MATKFKLSITPVVGVRIRRIGKDSVEVDFVCASADGQPTKTHTLREGEIWFYDLQLDASGWHDEVRRDGPARRAAPSQSELEPGGMGAIAAAAEQRRLDS